ncbi:topoisomerase DNA-binding C4 zinc finger domain-containing protein [Bacillus thuringiensis]|uniref:topoisomerase DNA-binding C4 zinc finger domain-containing protein n=1 Tax=Bacillus thuringiensis TaxID=1428 RepID=UPI002AB3316B|nr:topoisomerase DNA-binding C4 zinc finger domain-containing protein [Bacillus thuringiensis]MDY8166481.1 topoisomerase DNA-binding C4 zinc finger domain-containing protein [Bacillus thuringiensis]
MDFSEALENVDNICKEKNTKTLLYNLKFKELNITGIYFATTRNILISCNNVNGGWLIEVRKDNSINKSIPNDIYRKINQFFYDSKTDTYTSVKPLFEKLYTHFLNLTSNISKTPSSHELIHYIETTRSRDSNYDEKGEGEKLFFKTWSRQSVRKVSDLNLKKTRRWFGEDIYLICKENNVSSVWSHKPQKNSLKGLNSFIFLDPIKAKEELNKKKNICPQCKNSLVVINGKYGPFLGCSSFPDCEYKQTLIESK